MSWRVRSTITFERPGVDRGRDALLELGCGEEIDLAGHRDDLRVAVELAGP